MLIEIDDNSGFCFGVVTAIRKAEAELLNSKPLYCLGDIVHNSMEVERLAQQGLRSIDHEEFNRLSNTRVLLRAHGEPPSTYVAAQRNHITIIDATCPVVLHLQQTIKKAYQESDKANAQIVIYGKIGHAEVNGLVGQTEGHAIVIEGMDDISKIDFSKNIELFSQTTKSIEEFRRIVAAIQQQVDSSLFFNYHDTICRQVANRIPKIVDFVSRHDLVFFVSGQKSSNGRVLFNECKKHNDNIFMISGPADIDFSLLGSVSSVGICGATSTPKWLMEKVKSSIEQYVIHNG